MSKKDANIELFRVTAAILVVLLHVLGASGLLVREGNSPAVYWAAWTLETCAFCAVNCFALISGYVMVGKTVKLKSLLGLWLQAAFYSVLLTLLFFVFVPETRTAGNLLGALFPVLTKQWWYVSSYFLLAVFIPVLNAAAEHLPRRTLAIILGVILVGVGVFDPVIPGDAFALGGGYSPLWLMILYLFGAYLKKYNLREKLTAGKSLLGFGAMIGLTLLSKLVLQLVTKQVLGYVNYDSIFITYPSVTVTLAAVFLFLFCLNLRSLNFRLSKPLKRAICFVSPASLGVYLIHVHPLVLQRLLVPTLTALTDGTPALSLLTVLGFAAAVYLLCTAIELLRLRLFALLGTSKLCNWLDKKITEIINRADFN